MKMRIAYAGTALAVAMFVAGALGPFDPTDETESAADTTSAGAEAGLLSQTGRPGSTEALQDKVDGGEASAREMASLAFAYLQRSRDEAAPRHLVPARDLLEKSLEEEPKDNFPASLGMAALGNATHDFTGSVEWSRRAIAIDPYNASSYGLLGDALFELGRYDEAADAYQKMVDRRPDVASYVRASYSAQFRGRYNDALQAMELAMDAAPPGGEQAAWLRHQLGDIYATLGRFQRSERENRIGTQLAPGYVPPTVGIAESFIARDRLDEALPIMRTAADELPALEYLITLGDLFSATGDPENAADTYSLATEKLVEYRSAGVLPDSDFILFYADHGLRLESALAEGRSIYEDRPTSTTADALAWALYANEEPRAALRYSEIALAEANTPDALLHFHRGMIESALDNDEAARAHLERAVELDPAFSLVHRTTATDVLNERASR